MKITFIRRLLLTVIAFLVTVSANAQPLELVIPPIDDYVFSVGTPVDITLPKARVMGGPFPPTRSPRGPIEYSILPRATRIPGLTIDGRRIFGTPTTAIVPIQLTYTASVNYWSPIHGNPPPIDLVAAQRFSFAIDPASALQQQLAASQSALQSARANVARLTRQLRDRPTQAQLDAANRALTTARETVTQLQTALAQAQEDLALTRSDLAAAQTQIADLQRQLAQSNPPAQQTPNQQPSPATDSPQSPTGDGGGSSGGGAIAAVAAIGGALYFLKRKNPTANFNFAALPIDTDAYTAQFNYAPNDNLNLNFEFTEGNLFANNDSIKPVINRTTKLTVRWVW